MSRGLPAAAGCASAGAGDWGLKSAGGPAVAGAKGAADVVGAAGIGTGAIAAGAAGTVGGPGAGGASTAGARGAAANGAGVVGPPGGRVSGAVAAGGACGEETTAGSGGASPGSAAFAGSAAVFSGGTGAGGAVVSDPVGGSAAAGGRSPAPSRVGGGSTATGRDAAARAVSSAVSPVRSSEGGSLAPGLVGSSEAASTPTVVASLPAGSTSVAAAASRSRESSAPGNGPGTENLESSASSYRGRACDRGGSGVSSVAGRVGYRSFRAGAGAVGCRDSIPLKGRGASAGGLPPSTPRPPSGNGRGSWADRVGGAAAWSRAVVAAAMPSPAPKAAASRPTGGRSPWSADRPTPRNMTSPKPAEAQTSDPSRSGRLDCRGGTTSSWREGRAGSFIGVSPGRISGELPHRAGRTKAHFQGRRSSGK